MFFKGAMEAGGKGQMDCEWLATCHAPDASLLVALHRHLTVSHSHSQF